MLLPHELAGVNRFKTKQFLKTQLEWYQILQKHGFVDQEQVKGTELVLKQRSTNVYRQADATTRESKREYFLMLSRNLSKQKKISEVEAKIIHLFSDGIRRKEIAEILNINRHTIGFIIRRWEHRWGIRTWTPKQLDANWKAKRQRRKK